MIEGEVGGSGASASARSGGRPDRKTLWLIPGAHKTGSTTVQNIFDNNVGGLRKLAIHYVDREIFYKSDLRKYLVRDDGANADIPRHKAEASLLDITGYGGKSSTSVIFIENVFGEPLYGIRSQPRWNPKIYPDFESAAEKFHTLASPHYNIRCAYFIRRQDSFIESLYTHFVYRGFLSSETEFLPLLIGSDLSWNRNVSILRGMATDGNVGIVPFELLRRGDKAYIEYILDKLEITTDTSSWDLSARENRSLSKAGMEIAHAVYPHLGADERRRFFSNVRRQFNTGTGDRYSMFSPAMRRSLVKQYYPQNQLLLEGAGVDGYIVKEYGDCE
jgi:hypothetical protein